MRIKAIELIELIKLIKSKVKRELITNIIINKINKVDLPFNNLLINSINKRNIIIKKELQLFLTIRFFKLKKV